jgi:hypothetical protein
MGALLDAVPAGGADHTEHHRDLATAIEAVPAAYQPLDSDLTAIAALTTTSYGRGLLSLANQAALQAEAGGSALVAGVDYPTSATVTLSSADILDLHNTPITLVAAPGAGKVLVPHRVVSFMPTCTPYASTSTAYPILRYAGPSQPSTPLTEDVSYGTPVTWSAAVGNISVDTGSASNVALVATTDGAQFTDGDGTLTVTVWYSIEDVP